MPALGVERYPVNHQAYRELRTYADAEITCQEREDEIKNEGVLVAYEVAWKPNCQPSLGDVDSGWEQYFTRLLRQGVSAEP